MTREVLIEWPKSSKFVIEDSMVIFGDIVTKPKGWTANKWGGYVYSLLGVSPDGSPLGSIDDDDDEDDYDDD